jgi:hypothetical protein
VRVLAFALAAQLAAAARPSPPVLAFPETGLDDPVAYAGYSTRFFRDIDRNTVQIYLDRREGRVVHLFANAENESIGFTARTAGGSPAPVVWDQGDAQVWRDGRRKLLSYPLRSDSATLLLGRFVLGSMRIERDVQHFGEHRVPFTAPAYRLAEQVALLDAIGEQPAATRQAALVALRASSLPQLRQRLTPRLVAPLPRDRSTAAQAVIEQASLDALDTLRLTITPLAGTTLTSSEAGLVALRATDGPVRARITVSTTGRALTPLAREEIFTEDFLAWADEVRRGTDRTRAGWVERQITGVELLSSREKLMAGLPTYATYFGRDMLLSALMMQPIWRPEMSEFVIAAALRKLAPNGEVSHEEALGGQAIRETAAEVTALLRRADSTTSATQAAAWRRDAIARLREARRPRENYHMVDDEYQLPLMVARYLDDARVPAARKREWLLTREGEARRLDRLLAALAVVADRSAAYAASPVTANFVSFAPRDAVAGVFDGETRFGAQSWRDSGVGYGNGKYAMDVNAVYVPHALDAMQRILQALRTLGVLPGTALSAGTVLQRNPTLARYVRDSSALAEAVRTWQGAWRAFVVTLTPDEVQRRVAARVAAMPDAERAYWRAFPPSGAGLTFLALALDAQGAPVAVANSDPATRLFLDGLMGRTATGDSVNSAPWRAALGRDAELFTREYPEGLLLPAIGPVVANDAYSTPAVWQAFTDDPYHGPRVVWGREVNLFLLGIASHLPALRNDPAAAEWLRGAADRVREAVAASGFRSELWSYDFPAGRPQPLRYGSGGDVQLWSTTDLAVQYVWARLVP